MAKTTVRSTNGTTKTGQVQTLNRQKVEYNELVINMKSLQREHLAINVSTLRERVFRTQLDQLRSINFEAGYPDIIRQRQYKELFDREGIATRVVTILPEESWVVDPIVFETEEADETEFEREWNDLQERLNIYHWLQRIDVLSGIGQFGVLLLGISDGKEELREPIEGINERGEKDGFSKNELLFLRAVDETLVEVASAEGDLTNPRFGQPTAYTIHLEDPTSGGAKTAPNTNLISTTVHWSRVIHVADNRTSSEVFGVPRMQPVFNRLLDIRKLLAGSAEMFWKGGFPGLSFEQNPDIGDGVLDVEATRKQLEDYQNGLQRILGITGGTVKSLSPQVADPATHMAIQIEAIAITLGIPKRKFIGSEQAQLASEQDSISLDGRIAKRNNKYVSPMLIRPFIDRLIAIGVLPEPERYHVEWPDRMKASDEQKAIVAAKRTDAFGKYVQLGVDTLIPPLEYFTEIHGLSLEKAKAILEAANEQIADMGGVDVGISEGEEGV